MKEYINLQRTKDEAAAAKAAQEQKERNAAHRKQKPGLIGENPQKMPVAEKGRPKGTVKATSRAQIAKDLGMSEDKLRTVLKRADTVEAIDKAATKLGLDEDTKFKIVKLPKDQREAVLSADSPEDAKSKLLRS